MTNKIVEMNLKNDKQRRMQKQGKPQELTKKNMRITLNKGNSKISLEMTNKGDCEKKGNCGYYPEQRKSQKYTRK